MKRSSKIKMFELLFKNRKYEEGTLVLASPDWDKKYKASYEAMCSSLERDE